MTNEVKKVPELRFPEFDGEWEGIYLNKLGMFKKNYTFSRANEGDGTLRHIHYGDIHSKFKSKIEKIELLPSISIDLEDPQLVQNNDLIFADASEDYNDLGKTILMKVNNGNVIAGLHTHLFSPNNNLNSEFLLYFTQTKVYRKFIKRQGVGISVLGISKKNLDKLLVSLPKYNEQKKIGEFFSKLDRQIELEEEKLELLEQQKRGYMEKIFSQELRFKDENGNEYPEWENKKFLEIFKLVPSKKNQIKSSEVVENGIIPVVDQGKAIFLGYSNEKGKVIKDFDNVIVYGDHTTIVKYIKEPFIIGGDGVKLLTSNDGSLIHYLYILLQHFNVNPEGYKRHYSILKTKKMNISNTKEEQEKIGNFFEKQDNLIKKQSDKVELLKERKQGFLQKMFV
ncbi:restriction endonuclease subunit S [Mammaliicoccus sciuri]|uniref:restriction endonuclease subunit S n=1 Tax=Mammaliicoccus sciuri TaxID=1296 RepID=UPI002886A0CC|nr:restriction endonuclease subunit S [Mammaliicoccus sciuri]MDT0695009.1 restriction endonuclease subunit S [Mammaliicoccus sciuri]